ncbi:UNVERIFIED_ORG: hypothetical protein ABIB52_000503 [Arthrobacter sp. UYCu721]
MPAVQAVVAVEVRARLVLLGDPEVEVPTAFAGQRTQFPAVDVDAHNGRASPRRKLPDEK